MAKTREERLAYNLEYSQRPEAIASRRSRTQTSEYRDKKNLARRMPPEPPELKAKRLAEASERRRAYNRGYQLEYRQRPGVLESHRDACRKSAQQPANKERKRAYGQRPEVKACRSASARARWNPYNTVRKSAIKRGIPFEITKERFDALKPEAGTCCLICWNEMKRRTKHAPSFDRRDNSKGYVDGNVYVICKECNAFKSAADATRLYRLGMYAQGLLGTKKPEGIESLGLPTDTAYACRGVSAGADSYSVSRATVGAATRGAAPPMRGGGP